VYLFTLSGFATSSGRQFLYQEVITFVSNKSFYDFTIFVFCYPVLGKTKTYQLLVTSCPSKPAFYHSNLKLWCVQEGHRCTPKQPIRFQSFGWATTSLSGHRHQNDIIGKTTSRHFEEKYFHKGCPFRCHSQHFFVLSDPCLTGSYSVCERRPSHQSSLWRGEPWEVKERGQQTGMNQSTWSTPVTLGMNNERRTTNLFRKHLV
jgi:hypothetical protein